MFGVLSRWGVSACRKPLTPSARLFTTKSKSKEVSSDRVGMAITVHDKPGSLSDVLQCMLRHDINMTRIESKPSLQNSWDVDIFIHFRHPQAKMITPFLLADLGKVSKDVSLVTAPHVAWFPSNITDLDRFSRKTLDAGAELQADHPGFKDPEYRKRRQEINDIASTFKTGMEVPRVNYTANEKGAWSVVYKRLRSLYPTHACSQFNEILPLLERHCGYSEDNIPQLQDISRFLKDRTGFSLRPVSGLLSARDFLNALAFRVFYSTQYIRHHSNPTYTPEPDVCHELLGHAPMFADPDFADFSHEIGLASIGATDEQIKKLATCYWFSVEFGMCYQEGKLKAYGAGLLSSFGELEYCLSGKPQVLAWDPFKACDLEYPITTYQPTYFAAQSFADAKEKMREYAESLRHPFHVRFLPNTQSIELDREVITVRPNATA